ncbi:MAG: methyltransferase domain-containing protein [Acidobacteriota bacterium]
MDVASLYHERFSEADRAWKTELWKVLWAHTFAPYVKAGDTLLDLGAGSCEPINAARAARRIAVDSNAEVARHADQGVEAVVAPAHELSFLADGTVDVVFMSNFLEHMPDKDAVVAVLSEARRVLRAGGRLLCMGPNIRADPAQYWDFFDHHVALSDRSLAEVLGALGFTVERVMPRYLPLTTKSALPRSLLLVRVYLALMPLSSRILGRQFLIVARR